MFLIDSSFTAVSVPIIQLKKTHFILIITVVTSIICLFVTYLLVPKWGAYGGVFSIIAMSFTTGILSAIIKYNLIRQNWIEIKGMTFTLGYSIAISFYFTGNLNLSKIIIVLLVIVLTVHFMFQERNLVMMLLKQLCFSCKPNSRAACLAIKSTQK